MLRFINSARGLAIFMVIVCHCAVLYNFESKYLRELYAYGQLGVQLFFLVSAYTLCHSNDNRGKEKNALLSFYIRRYFRIFPVYYFGILLYFSLSNFYHDGAQYTFSNVVANIFFYHGFVPSANNVIVPGGWSIGTEMIFYLLFPFLYAFLKKKYMILKSIIIILFCYFLIYLMKVEVKIATFWYYNILVQLPVFLVGINFYRYNKKLLLKNAILIFIGFTLTTIVLWALKLAIFVPVSAAFSFCGLVKILEYEVFNLKFLEKLGKVSYSVYLLHFIFVFYLLPSQDHFIFIPIYIVVTTLFTYYLAVVSEKYLERPFIQLGSRIIKRINHSN